MTDINFEIREEIVKEIPEILKCYQCGTCVSSCLAERYGKAYSPRRKILMANYGSKDILAKELWRCVTCNNCNERCPQEVNPYDVLIKLKNYAIKKGLIDEQEYKEIEERVMETGRAMPVTDRTKRIREELGLEELKQLFWNERQKPVHKKKQTDETLHQLPNTRYQQRLLYNNSCESNLLLLIL